MKPYRKAPQSKLPNCDRLAIDRTLLANERTFLAYVRTFFTSLITGVSFIHLFPDTVMEKIGWALFPTALFILIWGIRSARMMRREMKDLQ